MTIEATRKIVKVTNDRETLYVASYTEEEIRVLGYKHGVYSTPNVADIWSGDLFQSEDFDECVDFAKAPRTKQIVSIHETGASLYTFDQLMPIVRMWRDGRIRLARFLLSDDISAEFWMAGQIHYCTFYKMTKES